MYVQRALSQEVNVTLETGGWLVGPAVKVAIELQAIQEQELLAVDAE